MSRYISVMGAIVLAAAVSGGAAWAASDKEDKQETAKPSTMTKIKHMSREEWEAVKKKWASEKEKWAACRNDAKHHHLTGYHSWRFRAECMEKS